MHNLSKQRIFMFIAALYCSCLIVSNIIAGKTFAFFAWQLPCAVVIFPIVYVLNDVMTEIYGFKSARAVVLTGFFANLIAVLAYAAAIALPSSQFFDAQSAFETVLGSTPRLLVASFAAYLAGSLLNAKIMDAMHRRWPKFLMARCITSTLVGETVDAAIFITISFVGTMPLSALATMVVLQAGFKTLYEVVVYPLTRVVITSVRKLPDELALARQQESAAPAK
jgi:uncharacterized integral membrane protein (TIGR00697 family)